MAQRVRFLRDFDFWPRSSVVVMHRAGQEKRLPDVQVKAALEAKAAEVIDGEGRQDERPKRAPAKAGPSA
ncbi:hypothetical protein GCM10008965_33650 [Methylorubrum aminovorans]|nr:hypothetical protein GCM10025880_27660 [Methylorubrum aminovorans]